MSDDPAIPRVFYRIVWTNPPTAEDFKNYFELGREPKDDPEWNRLASGLSMYADLSYARSKANRHPWKGNCYIAELRLPNGHQFRIEQSGPKGKHYTLWGDGDLLRSLVVRLLPVRKGAPDV
jgi:hypothetical protein